MARNLYPKWRYVDQYGELKYAFTRAQARTYNKQSGVKHPYAGEYLRRVRPQEYEEERRRILGIGGGPDVRPYPDPTDYITGFHDSRIGDFDRFSRYERGALGDVYNLAYQDTLYGAPEQQAMLARRDMDELLILRDLANNIIDAADWRTGPAFQWRAAAMETSHSQWFLDRWEQTGSSEPWFYWSHSVPPLPEDG